ncbi:MAG: DUF488 domain-containing protein [Deltaproteobacteria bacterium]|nr:DUF488 domain-containing protein [Deltaproteobacteria bacterium]
MAIRTVRLGSPRREREALRIGTVRRPPRRVRREEFVSKDFYDVWFPNLSPSDALLTEELAALSHHANLSIGCYCKEESRCHRSILRALLLKCGAVVV